MMMMTTTTIVVVIINSSVVGGVLSTFEDATANANASPFKQTHRKPKAVVRFQEDCTFY